jgi:tRNA A-37 threonylcarbamoyl transferase component Bud32
MAKIGRYEIEQELGRGAMGVVYLARDPHLHRQVAVKTYSLPDGISEDMAKEFHERFLREARAAASLSHPGLVAVYDAGEDPQRGLPYIAMEFVQGQSLKQRLEKGERLDPAWVLAIGAVLADALHVAHKAGIIHRDIKPANILIRVEDGAAKLADFGVARLKSSDLTQSGAALGSPGYMSPEQVKGGALDGRSDLFSLAVVLYEAFCGKRPFQGEDLVSLAYSIAHDTQMPLTRHLQDCPAGLNSFFDRALSKDPAKRYLDGPAFREAFLKAGKQLPADRMERTVVNADTVKLAPPAYQTVLAGPAETAPVPVHGRQGRLAGLTIAALALLAVGIVAAAYLRLGRPTLLRADDRGLHGPEVTSSTMARSAPLPVGSTPHEQAPQGTMPPQAGSVPRQESPNQAKATAPQGGVVRHQEPMRQARTAPQRAITPTNVDSVPDLPPMPRKIQMTLPEGTEIRLSLIQGAGSSTSQAGDTVMARITTPVVSGDRVVIPAGSSVQGIVSEAIPARKGLKDKAGSLSLSFDRVIRPDGSQMPMSAVLTRVGSKSTKKTAGIFGGCAAGGALLGKVLGGSTKDAAVGSVLGGAIGTGVAAGTRGEDVEIPAGSPLTINLDQPLTISITP